MSRDIERRLKALEEDERRGVSFPDFTAALMKSYATDEELAAWEAAGFPSATSAEFETALERVYGAEQ
jgi:hypothetical protein